MIKIKRVYDPPSKADGRRILVERLWPRGIKKTDLKLDAWLKEVAPSTELRKWFNHTPAKWKEFQRRYRAELVEHPENWKPILGATSEGTITLLFSSHDAKHNNVVALKNFLEGANKKTSGSPVKSSRQPKNAAGIPYPRSTPSNTKAHYELLHSKRKT
jgi:uncharacterized protein YeaO (DUF488 family)